MKIAVRLQVFRKDYLDLLANIKIFEVKHENIYSVGSQRFTESKASGFVRDKTSNMIIKDSERERELKAESDRLCKESAILKAYIDAVKNCDQKIILNLYYLEACSWRDVCFAIYGEKPDYEDRYVVYLRGTYQKHAHALKNVEKN